MSALDFRVSVRSLVAFTAFPPDITPLSPDLMELGRRAHVSRQEKSGVASEVMLSWTGEEEGHAVTVTGRMDLFDGTQNPPLIEEIKLSSSKTLAEPYKEHLLQAACYGFMLCERDGLTSVRLRVSYADTAGRLTAIFEEDWGYERLRSSFFDLLLPYLRWQIMLAERKKARDGSLASLPFPYPVYRPGQYEMAAQVYTSIQRKRRLFSVMPTGTGKSAAVLYPALKALSLNLTGKVFCLTARGTQRVSMQKELQNMRALGLNLQALTLNARESVCPMEQVRCHPDHCERAKGHFVRQAQALHEALAYENWDTEQVLEIADRHSLCPFEFSLALALIADVIVCDYNYAFDPMIRLSRVFDATRKVTLLVDEAHNLPDRARDMLSGRLSSSSLRDFRREAGKLLGRKSAVYQACTNLIRTLEFEGLKADPKPLLPALDALITALSAAYAPGAMNLLRDALGLSRALSRAQAFQEDYVLLQRIEKSNAFFSVTNLNPAPHLRDCTRKLSGVVFYSATLSPITAMRNLLGGEEEDACLALPSPFPKEHLLTLHLPVNTRYKSREASLLSAVRAISALFLARPGKMLAYFPSFAYLRAVLPVLNEIAPDLPLIVQESGMDEAKRKDFLSAFTGDDDPLLGLCVLGGVFAEGVDLPGKALTAVAIVGIGLPQVNEERDSFKDRMEAALGDGFAYAYRYPGMHKVLQAAGRLIRSDTDRGVLLLMDDRYSWREVSSLLPGHLSLNRVKSIDEITNRTKAFWNFSEGGGK
ncbi:MAG: ATP-dependent DNA helicase [Bacillota bacterium]|nr:ATP-dependent DNA helicase [Bacillota bacterium]